MSCISNLDCFVSGLGIGFGTCIILVLMFLGNRFNRR